MIDYSALEAIFGKTLPRSDIFFATRAARAIVPGYAALRREFGLSSAHTNRKVWKMFMAKYAEETAETTVPVTGVIVAPTTATLAPGATQQLTPTVAPANATNKSVTYSSSNEAVATVSVVGLITVKADATDGQTANITVTTADGAKTAVCVVTVETVETGEA